MPDAIGCVGLRSTGGMVVALGSGFHLFDPQAGTLHHIADPEADRPGNRFNDGKVSPDGRFFAGTMDKDLSRPTGALYRLDPDGAVTRVASGFIVSNGLAWSPDGCTMYHSDSRRQVLSAWSYDAQTGAIAAPRVIATPDEGVGRPDGGATDMEGCYWSAGISAGVLNRWSPDGRLLCRVPFPCTAPTMPCFGGPDLRRIYVTSARHAATAADLARFPLCGGIFTVDVDVPGVPVAAFRG